MSKRIIYLLLAVSLGLNVGVIAMTVANRAAQPPQGPPPGPGPGPADPARLVEGHLRGMTQHLDLNDEQQKSIREILERHTSQMTQLRAEADEAGRRLAEAYGAPNFDEERFRQLTTETGAARARMDSLSAEMLVAEASVLNSEQRRKFAAVAPALHSNPPQGPRRNGPPPR